MCMCLSIMSNDYFTDSDRNGRPSYYNAGMFLSHSGRYCQVLAATQCSGCSHIDFFLVVHYLEKVSIKGNSEDHVLHLPYYAFTPDWDVIHFQSVCSGPEFFIDLSAPAGVPASTTQFVVLCPWHINYV